MNNEVSSTTISPTNGFFSSASSSAPSKFSGFLDSINLAAVIPPENNNNVKTTDNHNTSSSLTSKIVEEFYNDLVDDVTFGLLLQVHRSASLGYLNYDEANPEFEKKFEIFSDKDVLGIFSNQNLDSTLPFNSQLNSTQLTNHHSKSLSTNLNLTGVPTKNGNSSSSSINNSIFKYECVCPNCERSLVATRFAPHLEKCMGLATSRATSRLATRRIANYNTDELDQLIEATGIIYNNHQPAATPITTANPLIAPSVSSTSLNSQEDDLMSTINAVATATTVPLSASTNQLFMNGSNSSSSSSNLIDVDLSSPSTHVVHHVYNHNPNSLKPPLAKKKRFHHNSSASSILPTSVTPASHPSQEDASNPYAFY